LHPASSKWPNGPRQDNSKVQVAKQGVNGALRGANLRLLLEKAPLREALALVAEVPLDRLEAMSHGALCPDETAFHIERTLKLPGKWLDGLNKEVPERTLDLLKNPDRAGLQDDDDFEEGFPASMVASVSTQPAPTVSVASQPAPAPTQTPAHDTHDQQVQGADGTASAPMRPFTTAKGAQGTETAQEAVGLAVGGAQDLASLESAPATGQRAATASWPAASPAGVQMPLSVVAPRSRSGWKDTFLMASPELRNQNLVVLLQGKGAKSALARVLQAKPPHVSAMLSGRKALDEKLCRDMALALDLPSDWFEAPRTVADIPVPVLQRLVPLRDAQAIATIAPSRATTEAAPMPMAASGTPAEAAAAWVDSSGSGTSQAHPGEDDAATDNPASQAIAPKEQQRRTSAASRRGNQQISEPGSLVSESASARSIDPVQAELLTPVEVEVQSVAQNPVPALHTEFVAAPAPVWHAAPVEVPSAASPQRTAVRSSDIMSVLSQPLIIEGGLAPITEALVKMLVLKAKQGALSEDKAFEMLGAVRLL
jgi:hypothetical protein